MDLRSVKTLLSKGADPNARDSDARTALFWVTNYSRTATGVVRALVNAGSDVNARDKSGETPLIRTLFLQGGLIGSTIVLPADRFEVVRALLNAGADTSLRGTNGISALETAVRYGDVKSIRALLARGADSNARDSEGRTPLCSVTNHHGRAAEVVSSLIDCGSDINARDKKGETPLMRAVLLYQFEVVEALLKAGADTSLRSANGSTALEMARRTLPPGDAIIQLLETAAKRK